MKRLLFFLAVSVFLVGCLPSFTPFTPKTATPTAGSLDFKWRLSGERSVAPQQIFSDRQQIWLHFAENQSIPAIFGKKDGQTYTLTYRKFPPYIIIEGVWPELVFQGGHLRAQAKYQNFPQKESITSSKHKNKATTSGLSPLDTEASKNSVPDSLAPAEPDPIALAISKRSAQPNKATTQSASQAQNSSAQKNLDLAAQTKVAPKAEPQPEGRTSSHSPSLLKIPNKARQSASPTKIARFSLGPDDDTLRQVFQRWAAQEGWSFTADHWELEVDYPILNAADFEGDFITVVEQVLKSVQLGAKPLRACFHSNRVLRVIPETHSCQPVHSEDS